MAKVDYRRLRGAHPAAAPRARVCGGNGSSRAALDSTLGRFRHFRVTAGAALLAALPHPGPVWRDRMRAVNRQTALRSLAMEFTAIIVFTAIALWFVTEVGGENL